MRVSLESFKCAYRASELLKQTREKKNKPYYEVDYANAMQPPIDVYR